MSNKHNLPNTDDPTGFASREMLIYLNPHNPIEARREAMKAWDRKLCGNEMDSYTEADIARECADSRAALGADCPTFTGPNV